MPSLFLETAVKEILVFLELVSLLGRQSGLRETLGNPQITLLPFTPFTNDALGRTNRTKQASLSSAAAKSKAGPS
jgi:hypothetical protein